MGWILGIFVALVMCFWLFSTAQNEAEHFCQDKYGSAYHIKNSPVNTGITWCQDGNGNMKASE